MTYRFYRISKNVAYLLIIASILLLHLGRTITWLRNHPSFAAVIFYCICALSLCIILFGIYAHLSKIKTVKKTDSPIILIIFGSILVLLAYGPPIALYFTQPAQTTGLVGADTLEKLREAALDPRQKAEGRLSAAKVYYRETGEVIGYLDLNGVKAFYSPDKNDRNYLLKRQYLENRAIRKKNSMFILLGFAIVFWLVFIAVLIWKPYRHR